MVRFQCDGKKKVRKTVFLGFCVEMSNFFAKISARVIKLVRNTCRLCNESIMFFWFKVSQW